VAAPLMGRGMLKRTIRMIEMCHIAKVLYLQCFKKF
jgi:hypothetical protein